MQAIPALLSLTDTAFFFDFDGTLVELAARPDAIQVPPSLPSLLRELYLLSQGAVAIITGRAIANLDAYLRMPELPAAGLHGAERRDARGEMQRTGFANARLAQMEHVLAELVQRNTGLLLESKGAALALHYRNAPEHEPIAREAVQQLVAAHADAYELQAGKMVYEIKPKGVNKGGALQAFLSESPFTGRTPFFAGDDLTDEYGFVVVNARNGWSIKVGDGATSARGRIASVAVLCGWLERNVAAARQRA